jgi:hypothetical protein
VFTECVRDTEAKSLKPRDLQRQTPKPTLA